MPDKAPGDLLPHARQFLILSTGNTLLQNHDRAFQDLIASGYQLDIAGVYGALPAGAHRLRAANTRTSGPGLRGRIRSEGRRAVLSLTERAFGARRRTRLAAKFDPWFRRAVQKADAVFLLDDEASVAAPVARGFNDRCAVYTGPEAIEYLRLRTAWDRLHAALAENVAGGEKSTPAPDEIISAARELTRLSSTGRLDLLSHEVDLVRITRRLVRRGRNEEALALVAAVADHLDTAQTGLEALRLSA